MAHTLKEAIDLAIICLGAHGLMSVQEVRANG
uniref:Uncharacterized protein n=1 Tax=Podoviridae sp. ctFbF42 TaxID=2825233 RepID=A0A8S5PXC8_9CAUD|nr:MAG TPA: hypothetical protein [Podoviridae sp. ctFbF42]